MGKPEQSDRVDNALELDDTTPASHHKIPLPLKIFGTLCIVSGAALVPVLVLLILGMAVAFQQGMITGELSTATLVIFIADTVLMTVLSVMFVILGIRLLRDKRRRTAQIAEVMIVVLILVILCDMMLSGLTPDLIPYGVVLVVLIALSSYVDPSLADERELQRKLRDMETREDAEDGTLGRDETGKGFIALNFFNLFWIFVVCCVIGLMLETVYHFLVVAPGHYEDRAGLLFGPFSPIYGFGAVLMTVALNRFHDKNVILIFLVSAVIGGGFEYLTSWFMQFAFGIVAWDYTGTFLSIDGRTNGMFMAMWGVLGVVWIKLLLPWMLKLVNLIPWNWRYTLTTACAVLMIVDGGMTLLSLDCWYQRMAGKAPETAVEQFFGEHFDNQYMEQRFQSMSIDPNNATRAH
ncbi:putative ABC transporter permease [Eggerthella sinensis]|uniref:putative ABC transporter permease n=1 Tax=Eggerthella sinensis TaxID=242230 RepID=UPI001D06E795|nr:putative ABC transporter permease [Eggerthella sinensis]MCB7038287.1 putative ABC transporter permease [Eggerthella sinensis]